MDTAKREVTSQDAKVVIEEAIDARIDNDQSPLTYANSGDAALDVLAALSAAGLTIVAADSLLGSQ